MKTNRHRLTAAGSVCCFLLVFVTPAHAYVPFAFKRGDQAGYVHHAQVQSDTPIPFEINVDGTPDVPNDPANPAIDGREATELAFRAWQSVPNRPLTFALSSTTIKTFGNDGHNVFYFDPNYDYSGGAVTLITYDNTDGHIIDVDIRMNDHDIRWFTSLNDAATGEPLGCPCQNNDTTSTYRNDIQGIATHEIGHALGLAHTPIGERTGLRTPTMYADGIWGVAGEGTRPPDSYYRSLELDDLLGIRFIYGRVANAATPELVQVEGRAIDPHGVAAFGGHVVAHRSDGIEVGAVVGFVNGAITPDSYKLWLPPGTYQMRVEPIDGTPPSNTAFGRLGGIVDWLGDALTPVTDFPKIYHPFSDTVAGSASYALTANTTRTFNFGPAASFTTRSRFKRTAGPVTLRGELQTWLTGPLSAAALKYQNNGGSITTIGLGTATPFVANLPAFAAGDLVEYWVEVQPKPGPAIATPHQRIQVGLSGQPLLLVSKMGAWTISAVDTKTLFEVDEVGDTLSFPTGQAFAKGGVYVANFGNDSVSYIPLTKETARAATPIAGDLDGDDLLDVQEALFCSDSNKADSDGDLVLDGDEVSETVLSPVGSGAQSCIAIGGTFNAAGGLIGSESGMIHFALFNETTRAWASAATPTTPSGRFRVRIPVGQSFSMNYYYGVNWAAGGAPFACPAGGGQIVNAGVTTVSAAVPTTQPFRDSVATSPCDPTDGLRLFDRRGIISIPLEAGADPYGVAVDKNGFLYVAAATADKVYKIDTATNALVGQASVGVGAEWVTTTPDGSKVYVANSGENNVTVLDAATLAVRKIIPVASHPLRLSVTSDGSTLVVGGGGSQNNLAFVAVATDTVLQEIASGLPEIKFLGAQSPDGKTLIGGAFTTNVGKLALIDVVARSVRLLDPQPGITTSGVALSGTRAYAINYFDPELLEIDTTTGAITRRTKFGIIDIRDLFVVKLGGCNVVPGSMGGNGAGVFAIFSLVLAWRQRRRGLASKRRRETAP